MSHKFTSNCGSDLCVAYKLQSCDRSAMNEPFHFRAFSLVHTGATMKVGTDSILLGAWAGQAKATRILDIGTGSGVLALMLAQRFPQARVHAIEPDKASADCALMNAANSPFCPRVEVFQAGLEEWKPLGHYYDLIVCNPPFFNTGPETPRAKARYARFLGWRDILSQTRQMADHNAELCLVLPYESGLQCLAHAENHGWYPKHLTEVVTVEGKPPGRTLLRFSPAKGNLVRNRLVIRSRNGYTEAYTELVADYLIEPDGQKSSSKS
jgi:tRNA1Val (adenine37-N6)-methyltransferase